MSTTRDQLQTHLDTLLDAPRCRDYCHNGCQVEGSTRIERLATATTASQAAIDAAVEAGAEALLVHHGILWGGVQRIHGMLRKRLGRLLGGDCSLFAYHLPLDAHAEVGNNVLGLKALGINPVACFAPHHGIDIGWIGDLTQPTSIDGLIERCMEVFHHPVMHCPGSSQTIKRVGIVTGGGQSHLLDAAASGCDAFITGEASEQSWHEAAENGCHLLACGHHATESIAVHELGEQLAQQFGLTHLPLRLPNPV